MIHPILAEFTSVTLHTMLLLAILAGLFTALSLLAVACNKTPPWWRKPDLSTDLCWAFLPKLIYGWVQTLMLTLGMTAFYGISDPNRFFAEGHGPLAGLPPWWQAVLYLLGNDFVMYVTHRLFHSAQLWRFHAVHHSSEQLEWVSAGRFHPVDQIFHSLLADVVMLLLGIPPEILLWLLPFNAGSSALLHANLDWTFGPFRTVLASPVYHRWHHTSAERGGSSNFAGTFPVFDLLFGTYFFPVGELPDGYGVDEPNYPRDFVRQLLHPFRRAKPAEPAAVLREGAD